jgi:hypothetical protein
VSWEEVSSAVGSDGATLRFGPDEVLARVDTHGDLFSEVIELRQRLPDEVAKLLSAGAP